jgi:putative redox protein
VAVDEWHLPVKRPRPVEQRALGLLLCENRRHSREHRQEGDSFEHDLTILPASGFPASRYRLLTSGYWLPASDFRLLTFDFWLLATGDRRPTVRWRMSNEKPPAQVELTWEHDLVFKGTSGEVGMTLDSAAVEGPSPMQALAFGLTGCMAMDLLHILQKGRHQFSALRAELTGRRSPADPKRFTDIDLHFVVTGIVPDAVVQRGIDLSREKYCSVWQSMRQDIVLTVTFAVTAG